MMSDGKGRPSQAHHTYGGVVSETIRTYHSDRCEACGALLPADDWSSVTCPDGCTVISDGTVANWQAFWETVARLHTMYGTLEEES